MGSVIAAILALLAGLIPAFDPAPTATAVEAGTTIGGHSGPNPYAVGGGALLVGGLAGYGLGTLRGHEVPKASPVPEPATIGVLGVGCAALIRRRRRA